jgi:hypothetical protein
MRRSALAGVVGGLDSKRGLWTGECCCPGAGWRAGGRAWRELSTGLGI